MDKTLSREVKIAIVAIIGVVALFFGLNFLKGMSFSPNNTYTMTFSDAKGLTKSTAIYADGYKVGTVKDIAYDYDKPGNITVEVEIDPDLRIPLGTKAEIASDLMGNMKVNLLLANNPRQKVEVGGTIPGVDSESMMAKVNAMMPAIEAMIPKLDSIVTAINILVNDPAIANTLHNVESMSQNLRSSTAELDAMMQGVNQTLPTIMGHVNNSMKNTERLTNNLANIDVAGTMAKVNQTLDNVEQLTRTLNSNEGTLGKLMHDPGMYDNMNSMMSHADSLVIDLKAHPKRYVHFSIFGRKDK